MSQPEYTMIASVLGTIRAQEGCPGGARRGQQRAIVEGHAEIQVYLMSGIATIVPRAAGAVCRAPPLIVMSDPVSV
jgi:hypothetical protein